jgi:hypothetical protein
VGAWQLGRTTETPDPSPSVASAPLADTGSRLVIDTVDLDVPLSVLVVENRVVDPPDTEAAYLLANHGYPPSRSSEGTVFIALHAMSDGVSAPGNLLANTDTRQPRLTVGDIVTADGVAYIVTEAYTARKNVTRYDEALWNPDTPNRLVILTCLPNTSGRGHATHNVVIIAQHART